MANKPTLSLVVDLVDLLGVTRLVGKGVGSDMDHGRLVASICRPIPAHSGVGRWRFV